MNRLVRFSIALGLLGALPPGPCLAASSARIRCFRGGSASIPSNLLIHVQLTDRVSALMVLDTGSPTTVISDTIASEIEGHQSEPGVGAAAPKFLDLPHPKVGAFPLRAIHAEVIPWRQADLDGENDGVLGADAFAHCIVEVDAGAGFVTFIQPPTGQRASGVSLKDAGRPGQMLDRRRRERAVLQSRNNRGTSAVNRPTSGKGDTGWMPLVEGDDGHYYIDALLNGWYPTKMALDTGAQYSWISDRLVRQLQLRTADEEVHGRLLSGEVIGHRVHLDSLAVAGFSASPREMITFCREKPSTFSAVGMDVISQFKLTIDLPRLAARLQPSKGGRPLPQGTTCVVVPMDESPSGPLPVMRVLLPDGHLHHFLIDPSFQGSYVDKGGVRSMARATAKAEPAKVVGYAYLSYQRNDAPSNFSVIDLSTLRSRFPGIHGVAGCDMLESFCGFFDFQRGVSVFLEKGASGNLLSVHGEWTALPFRVGEALDVGGICCGKRVWFRLGPGTINFIKQSEAELFLEPTTFQKELKNPQLDLQHLPYRTLRPIALGRMHWRHPQASVVPDRVAHFNSLGSDFLNSHQLLIDLSNRRVLLSTGDDLHPSQKRTVRAWSRRRRCDSTYSHSSPPSKAVRHFGR